MNNRSIRIFLSSTFRDFGEDRDLLVKRVFPALRAQLKDCLRSYNFGLQAKGGTVKWISDSLVGGAR